MGDNVYIAYVLWLLMGRFSGHGFYPNKFASGFAMVALFFIGYSLAWCFSRAFLLQTFCNLFYPGKFASGFAMMALFFIGYGLAWCFFSRFFVQTFCNLQARERARRL